jgi:membrane protease YdiL (CAAX protease family)
MSSHKTNVRREVGTFLAVTYLAAWGLFFAGSRTGILPLVLLGIWAPSLAGMLLTLKYHGRRGLAAMLSRFGRMRVAVVWWLLLLLLPASVHFAGRTAWQLFSGVGFHPALWISLPTVLTSILLAGLGEELGWRGFALPRLQRVLSPLQASLLLAAIHFAWHLPTYWLGEGIHNVPLIFAAAFIVPWSIIFTWLYNRSGGSLLFAVGFHGVSNISLAAVRFMPLDSEVPISPALITQLSLPAELAGPYLSVVGVYWLVALLVIARGGLRPANTDVP